MRRGTLLKGIGLSVAALPLLVVSANSVAGPTIDLGKDKSLSIGAGLRIGAMIGNGSTPSGDGETSSIGAESARLFFGAKVAPSTSFSLNTEHAAGHVQIMDAVAKFEMSEMVNVWAGRFLPPSDRSNLNGPYYITSWAYPGTSSNYPQVFQGRDDGVALWGQVDGGRFKYQVGAFEGLKTTKDDSALWAGRLTYQFWTPESGYFNSGTYYGAMDVLAVGVAAMQQKDGAIGGDMKGWNLDVFMEKKLSNSGVLTAEGAYYNFDKTQAGVKGTSLLATMAYLFPDKMGPGQIQPAVRYQSFDPDTGSTTERTDVGVNYVIDGHNARLNATFTDDNSDQYVQFGIQLQI